MSPTWAIAPTLSRSWVAVCVTCPALHAERATGDNRATPTMAARRARVTAVDLHTGSDAGHRGRWTESRPAYRSPHDDRREVRSVTSRAAGTGSGGDGGRPDP